MVLATEKKMPSILVDEQSLHKVVKLNDKIGMVYSGMGPDSRVLMNKGRKLAQQYFRVRVLQQYQHFQRDLHSFCWGDNDIQRYASYYAMLASACIVTVLPSVELF